LEITADPPHVWHQEVVAAGHAPGFDGIVNDYFLIRTNHFEPRGELTDDELAAAENLAAFRWWRLSEIAGYTGVEGGPRLRCADSARSPAVRAESRLRR
jgi:hypothetical protein